MLTAEDVRVEIARRRIPIYKLSALVSVHPSRLSLIINGKIPMTPAIGARLMAALQNSDRGVAI